LLSVDDFPSIMFCANELGVVINIQRQPGPMPEFVLNELCCSLVLLHLKLHGSVAVGDQGTYTVNKQLRPDEVQCIQFHEMRLVQREVVAAFSPMIFRLKKLDAAIYNIRKEQFAGEPVGDDVVTRCIAAGSIFYALPKMTPCRIVQYSSDPPSMSRLMRLNLKHDLCKNVPQTEIDYRNYWKSVHRMVLPDIIGGYLKVEFPSGDIMTYPASCIATNWSLLAKQTRMEGSVIVQMLIMSLKSSFGSSKITIREGQDECKTAIMLPASALMNVSSIQPIVAEPRKRRDSPLQSMSKRKCIS
jgi:hypothetical protein